MFGLTPLGTVHTAISLIALAAGILALIQQYEIRPGSLSGRIYTWSTVLTCLTAFGIFERGGFGLPHALGVLTLIVLGVASLPGGRMRFGFGWRYVVAVCYSTTLFFHLVPAIAETFSRIPMGSPLFSSPEDPALQKVFATLFLLFAVGIYFQVRHLRNLPRTAALRTVS